MISSSQGEQNPAYRLSDTKKDPRERVFFSHKLRAGLFFGSFYDSCKGSWFVDG